VNVKRLLSLALVIAFAVFVLSAALDYGEIEKRYRTLIEDFLNGKEGGYASFVSSQLPYMALYRFYKIKMVGSIDRREAALSSSNFLSALIEDYLPKGESLSDIWGIESISAFWKIEEICVEEEAESGGFGFLGGFGFGGGGESEGDAEEKLRECVGKVLKEYGEVPKVEGELDFNDLFSKALFLAYVEAYLKHVSLKPSMAMASNPLSLVYAKYSRYVTSEMKKAVKHALLYYSGLVDEPLPFKIEGLEVRKCEKCGKFEYRGQDKLPFVERDYSYKGLSLKEVLRVIVDELSKMEFKDEEDFNWKVRMAAFFVYDDMMKKNLLGQPIYRNLRNNMLDILSHTIAYYLGATQTPPPIDLGIPVRSVKCEGCFYEMFRYSAAQDLVKLFKSQRVIEIIEKALEEMRKKGIKGSEFEKFSSDVADEVISALRLEDTKQDLANLAAKAAPKEIDLWWLRYVLYGLLIFAGWKAGKIRQMLIISVILEIAYVALFMDPVSLGEGLLYSLLSFFTFSFAFMMNLAKFKSRWLEIVLAALFVIIVFLPEFPHPKNLSMDENSALLQSKFHRLLVDDLYDGYKYREFLQDPMKGFFAVSELGRTLDRLLSSKDPLKSRDYKKAVKLTERIAKYSNDELRRDFLDFLEIRMKGKEELKERFTSVVKGYMGKPAVPPSVPSSETFGGLRALVIFAFLYFLWSVGLRDRWIGVAALALGIYLIFAKGSIFVEYGVPVLSASGSFIPLAQILLMAISILFIFKSSERRVKA